MGGKKSSPAPAATPTQQVITPDVDTATAAAEKALAAQGNVRASQAATDEEQMRGRPRMGDVAPRPRRRQTDAATTMNSSGAMGSSAILTG